VAPQVIHHSDRASGFTEEFWYYEYIGYLAWTKPILKIPFSYGIELGFLAAGRFMLPDDADFYTRFISRFVPFPPNGTVTNLFLELRSNLGARTHGFRIVVPFSMRIDNKMNAPLLEFVYTLYWQ